MRTTDDRIIEMKSSYATSSYGELFKAIVRVQKPKRIVEFGILEGYSTFWFLDGLKANRMGQLHSYDLFEEYPHNHARYDAICCAFRPEIDCGWLKVLFGDFWKIADQFEDGSIDLLHVDISNDGDTFEFFFTHYLRKLAVAGLAIVEGGGRDRDKVEWMIKYAKRPIRPVVETLGLNAQVTVLEPYPSITLVRHA